MSYGSKAFLVRTRLKIEISISIACLGNKPESSLLSPCTSLILYAHICEARLEVPSHGRNMYFISLIDDDNRKVRVCLLKNKDETFKEFVDWKVRVKIQCG